MLSPSLPLRRNDQRVLDHYVNRIIGAACTVSLDDVEMSAPREPVSNSLTSLRCKFFTDGDSGLWDITIAKAKAEKEGDGSESMKVGGGDVYATLPSNSAFFDSLIKA